MTKNIKVKKDYLKKSNIIKKGKFVKVDDFKKRYLSYNKIKLNND